MGVQDFHIQSSRQQIIDYMLQLALHVPIADPDAGDAENPAGKDVMGLGFTHGYVEFRAQSLHDGFDAAPFVFQAEDFMEPKFNRK